MSISPDVDSKRHKDFGRNDTEDSDRAARGPGRSLPADLRGMWTLLELSPRRVLIAVVWGVAALGSALALAALSAWLIARAWEMPPVLDLSVAVVAVRALGISRGLARYLERLATHDVALRSMTVARTSVYRVLARSDIWSRRAGDPGRSSDRMSGVEIADLEGDPGGAGETGSAEGYSVGTGVRDGGSAGAGEFGGSVRDPVGAGARDGDSARAGGSGTGPVGMSVSDHGRGGSSALAGDRTRDRDSAGGGMSSLRRGDLLVRIGSDIDDLGAVVVRALVPVAVAIVLSVAAVALLGTISVPAAAILAAALVVTGVLAPWLSARAARDAEIAVRTDRAEFTAHAMTVLDHAAELRVAGRLDEAVRVARDAGRRAVAAEDSAASSSAWAVAMTPVSIGVSVLAALLIGITVYGPGGGAPGAMTPMALTILVLLPLSAFEAVGPLPVAAQTLTTARAAYRRLIELRDGPERAASNLVALPDRPAGRRVAVVGPSGAGKTTLLMHWAGLFDTPHPGVTFFAEDAHLFGTTVLENLRVARGDLTEAEAEKALRAVGLGDWLDDLPEGLDTDLVGGAAAVSGGQRRRILLARALVAPAEVLLLDEPTEHLEAEAGARLLCDLLDPASGLVEPDRTVVLVTHQLPTDHRADLVVHVDAQARVTLDRPPVPPTE